MSASTAAGTESDGNPSPGKRHRYTPEQNEIVMTCIKDCYGNPTSKQEMKEARARVKEQVLKRYREKSIDIPGSLTDKIRLTVKKMISSKDHASSKSGGGGELNNHGGSGIEGKEALSSRKTSERVPQVSGRSPASSMTGHRRPREHDHGDGLQDGNPSPGKRHRYTPEQNEIVMTCIKDYYGNPTSKQEMKEARARVKEQVLKRYREKSIDIPGSLTDKIRLTVKKMISSKDHASSKSGGGGELNNHGGSGIEGKEALSSRKTSERVPQVSGRSLTSTTQGRRRQRKHDHVDESKDGNDSPRKKSKSSEEHLRRPSIEDKGRSHSERGVSSNAYEGGATKGEPAPQEKPLFFDNQVAAAKELVEKIKRYLKTKNKSLTDFEDITFVILLPNMRSLCDQTIDRIRGFVAHERKKNGGGIKFFQSLKTLDLPEEIDGWKKKSLSDINEWKIKHLDKPENALAKKYFDDRLENDNDVGSLRKAYNKTQNYLFALRLMKEINPSEDFDMEKIAEKVSTSDGHIELNEYGWKAHRKITKLAASYGQFELRDFVLKADRGSVEKSRIRHRFKDLGKDAPKDPQPSRATLFVLSGPVNTLVNQPQVREADNVITLQVSATPYNLLTSKSQIPEKNEVYLTIPAGYYGIERFVEKTKKNSSKELLPSGELVCDTKEFEKKATKRLQELDAQIKKNKAKKNALADLFVDDIKHAFEKYGHLASSSSSSDSSSDGTSSAKSKYEYHSELTRKMIEDLCTINKDGKGKMILIRFYTSLEEPKPNKPRSSAEWTSIDKFAKGLRNARDKFDDGKLRDKIPIIFDQSVKANDKDPGHSLEDCVQASFGLNDPTVNGEEKQKRDSQYKEFRKKVKGWHKDDPDFKFRKYEDLEDVPCILVLVMKGKMGDTFPKSLRYYDMRLRWITTNASNSVTRSSYEQSIGRAFGYKRNPQPTILLSRAMHKKLCENVGISKFDNKMKKITRPKLEDDSKEEEEKALRGPNFTAKSSSALRKRYKPHDHYDLHNYAQNNESRFLIVGRPQIGKTGTFLCTLKMLHDEIRPGPRKPGIEDADLDDAPQDDEDLKLMLKMQNLTMDDEGLRDPPKRKVAGFEHWPQWKMLKAMPFDPTAGAGKYGDPSAPEVWKHFVIDKERSRFRKGSSTTCNSNSGASKSSSESKPGNSGSSDVQQVSKRDIVDRVRKNLRDTVSEFYATAEPTSNVRGHPKVVNISFKVEKEDFEGLLYIPHRSFEKYWKEKSWSVMLKTPGTNCAPFPIFMPSHGRPKKAKLNLRGMMANKDYVQIVCLKSSQLGKYREIWPDLTFFVLPACAESRGIGASRFWMIELAKKIVPKHKGRRVIFVADDSIYAYRGVTLPGDKNPIHHEQVYPYKPRVSEPISLRSIMDHFDSPPTTKDFDFRKFAVIGFRRFNGWPPGSKKAYERRHVVSAGLYNIDEIEKALKQKHYDREVFVLEDLDFNLRLSGITREICDRDSKKCRDKHPEYPEDHPLIVRCNRYVQCKNLNSSSTQVILFGIWLSCITSKHLPTQLLAKVPSRL
eukprot:g1101.t1